MTRLDYSLDGHRPHNQTSTSWRSLIRSVFVYLMNIQTNLYLDLDLSRRKLKKVVLNIIETSEDFCRASCSSFAFNFM